MLGGLYISPPQVAEILKKDVKEIYHFIAEGKLKARFKKLYKQRMYQIEEDNLMTFLENNQDLWDSRNVEKYALGSEPDWLQEKRKKDVQKKRQGKSWTTNEEAQLKSYIKAGYPMKEIAHKLGRSVKGIYRRAQTLREAGELRSMKVHLYWTDEEWNMMLGMERRGLSDEKIAHELGRDVINIRDKRRNMRAKGLYIGNKARKAKEA